MDLEVIRRGTDLGGAAAPILKTQQPRVDADRNNSKLQNGGAKIWSRLEIINLIHM